MATVLLSSLLIYSCAVNNSEEDLTKYVDPFIGNADNGHTFPGACLPFGMIQASPESGNRSWRYCSGYNYDDEFIYGFAQTHLNGTGVPDLGDILMFPFCKNTGQDFKSRYNKENRKASPGYYAVELTDAGVAVELTATHRTAFHKYTFHGDSPAQVYIDLTGGLTDKSISHPRTRKIFASQVEMPDNKTITGFNRVKAWVERDVYYAIQFDRPYTIVEEISGQDTNAKQVILAFDIQKGESVQAKIGLSTVSIDGAKASLEKENPGWDFAQVKKKAALTWNELLSRVRVQGTEEQKTVFYTSLYHLYIQPNDITDTDGRYRGVNDSVFHAARGSYYSTLSLWDTYRAAHPLYTILTPERVDDMVQSMLDHAKVQGFLPIWTLWGKENFCMIGNHAIPVMVDAYLKGFTGFDAGEAFQAIKNSSTTSHMKSNWEIYMQYGYYPFDLVKEESVSRTLESCYDDYCVAQMAKALGKEDDYICFTKRAGFYKNLFDTETRLMRGRDSNGNWRTPFQTFSLSHAGTAGGDYTEGNAWQYTWHVQHDINGLIELMNGKENFVSKLDSLFFLDTRAENRGFTGDVTGLIGQYAHGNEPSHHVAYMYSYADRKDKTEELIREIFDRFYLPEPDGLCGNDDCGQMSAWYIFSAMGFYPVDPISGEYVLGAPQIEQITLSLPGNKTFTVEAKNLTKENKYVESVVLNGKSLTGLTIKHQDIMNGGSLVFTMKGK
ncbi:glycoside hydrolase family 92 protein [Bacteroides sp. 51]|nr:glycoside hydrolase family 92 protein [Bacteroides sp. 51]